MVHKCTLPNIVKALGWRERNDPNMSLKLTPNFTNATLMLRFAPQHPELKGVPQAALYLHRGMRWPGSKHLCGFQAMR